MSLAYPVREQIRAATKHAKLTPRPAPGDGAEAFTVRRLHQIRTMFLAATPFVIAGEIPRPPDHRRPAATVEANGTRITTYEVKGNPADEAP